VPHFVDRLHPLAIARQARSASARALAVRIDARDDA
jgi:hypothetical protein